MLNLPQFTSEISCLLTRWQYTTGINNLRKNIFRGVIFPCIELSPASLLSCSNFSYLFFYLILYFHGLEGRIVLPPIANMWGYLSSHDTRRMRLLMKSGPLYTFCGGLESNSSLLLTKTGKFRFLPSMKLLFIADYPPVLASVLYLYHLGVPLFRVTHYMGSTRVTYCLKYAPQNA